MKKILMTLSLLAIIILTVIIGGSYFPNSLFGRLWSSRQSAIITDVELEYLSQLNTAEYRMRLIFPYDFAENGTDWTMYKNLWEFHPEEFRNKIDKTSYADGELPQTWAAGPFYASCREIGIDPFMFRYDFLVLPIVVKAGMDLSDMEKLLGADPMIEQDLSEEGKTVLMVDLPQAEITSLIVEDLDAREWGYPDPPVSPEELKKLIDFLMPYIEERVLESGILDEADIQARILMDNLFIGSGVSDVQYF